MGKKYLDTKEGSLEQSVLGVWQTAIEEGDARMDGRTKGYKEHRAKLEAARLRKEKLTKKQKQLDVDGDGEIEGSDLAKLRKKAKKEEVELDEGKMRDLSIKIDDIVAKMKKDKNMKGFADKFKKDAMKSMDIEKSLEKVLPDYIAGKEIQKLMGESYEIGTDEYRKHTEDVTPGQDGEWVEAVNAKNISMREALAKVWGVDEGKSPFKKEDKKDDKTLTGKKVASVDVNPTIKEKTK